MDKKEEINNKKQRIRGNFKKVLPIFFRNKKELILFIVFATMDITVAVLAPIYFANALAALVEGAYDTAIRCITISLCCTVLRNLFGFLRELQSDKMNVKTQNYLQVQMTNSILETEMGVLDDQKLGKIAGRLSSDTNVISRFFLLYLGTIFSILQEITFLVYIATLNMILFGISVFDLVIMYISTFYINKWRSKKYKERSEKMDAVRSITYEQVMGAKDIKLLNMEESLGDYTNKCRKDLINFRIDFQNKLYLLLFLNAMLGLGIMAIFYYTGIHLVSTGIIVAATFLIINSYFGKATNIVDRFSFLQSEKAEVEVSSGRVLEILHGYKKEEFGTIKLDNFSGQIEYKDVHFSYSETEVLKGINIKFEPGMVTAIVGKSGSGKTTILNTLSKLYPISSGEILFDEENQNSLTRESIRSNVGQISQMPYIFDTTVKQNLLFAAPNATDEELADALQQAQLYDDIKEMKNGLDTIIGENGIKLSGGQRQRLAIARLLLKQNKVIVFDEATSSLDNNSQSKIVEILDALKKDRTIIVVAHRLSTIVNADKIYVLKDGEIIANGKHKALMQTCEYYKTLYSSENQNSIVEQY